MNFNQIKGHAHVKRALEVASAGGHSVLLVGPPGMGKTMLIDASMSIDLRQKVIAAWPCPCGYWGDKVACCICDSQEVTKYRYNFDLYHSDIVIDVPRLRPEELMSNGPYGESSNDIYKRVKAARIIQEGRSNCKAAMCFEKVCNAKVFVDQTTPLFRLTTDVQDLMKAAINTLGLSANSYDVLMRIARTIADLDAQEHIKLAHLAEALQYRNCDTIHLRNT